MNSINSIIKIIEKDFVQIFFLSLFAILFLFFGLDVSPLIDWDENIYAEASRQMLIRDNYLNMYINGYPFAEKPPFFFWLQSFCFKLFGVDEFSARFPSAFVGLLQTYWLYFVGRTIYSHRLGILWSIIYLSSFLPGIFARSAVIDHTFNFFISLATFLLLFYDHKIKKSKYNFFDFKFYNFTEFVLLFLASLSMGLAVLTKGPLGGVIPLVAYASYKLSSNNKIIPLSHIIYCGLISLFIASSWYITNWHIYGSQFLLDFIEFQKKLFNQSLEGHTGPFYYHFLIVIFGILPWTPLLFLGPNQIKSLNFKLKYWVSMSIGWILFVLILFSFVSTKLPHYSASVYLPVSLLISIILENILSKNQPLPVWFNVTSIITGIFIGLGFIFFPFIAEQQITERYANFKFTINYDVIWVGSLIFVLLIFGAVSWMRNKIWRGIILYTIAFFFFSQGLWRYQVPMGLSFLQDPMLKMVNDSINKNQPIVFYRYVSFAALFYGRVPITMLHTYKFPGDPAILNQNPKKSISVITTKSHVKDLVKEHPLVKYVKENGKFVMFEILPLN